MAGDRMLTASEIGEYAYCRRSWWFHRVKRIESRNLQAMSRGTEAHVAHGRNVRLYRMAWQVALLLLFLATLLLVAWALGMVR